MTEQTLADIIDATETSMSVVSCKEILPHILNNLNPNLKLRPYQEKALKRFLFYAEDYKTRLTPVHLLFEMATGSGKTLVMAALILDLYKRGYRNFMFFVNATNIIEKTKDNFLNQYASKYLFNEKIIIDDREVTIRPVENFDEANLDDINIHFTTIQGLHTRLNNPSENSVTYEDFEERKIIMLSDEAHHTNTLTKGKLTAKEQEEDTSWENTVQRIFKSDKENYLLEFTATAGLGHPKVKEKYRDRILYQYTLKEFRIDGYSKEVDIFQADMESLDRAFQAVILSQYRRKIAEKNGLHIKPVILMKSKKIDESKNAEMDFYNYIDNLTSEQIRTVAASASGIVKLAFDFFLTDKKIKPENLVRELQQDFSREKCLSVNSKDESDEKQIQVNTLEDEDNELRVIFVVDKLNEGWDVLNLFDIVRLNEGRDAKSNKPGKTTVKEAQLIGRGARYCPFVTPNDAESAKDKRKYDDDPDNELRLLETLYYHSRNDSRYIQEIRAALRESGVMPDNKKKIDLKVKKSFKETDFYKNDVVFVNEPIINKRDGIAKLTDYLPGTVFEYKGMMTGRIGVSGAFDDKTPANISGGEIKYVTLQLKDFPAPILQKAVDKSGFFHFNNIRRHFPEQKTMDVMKFLAPVKVEIYGLPEQVDNPSPQDMLKIALFALGEIEAGIKGNSHDHQGSKTFKPKPVKEIVQDKTMNIAIDDSGDREYGIAWNRTTIGALKNINLFEKDWFVYEDNFGTSEEKYLIGYISKRVDEITNRYDEFYLIRNEGGFKLYAFENGRPMEPDFLLCARKKGERESTMHQIFIEAKGSHLIEHDQWKEDFLMAIENDAEPVVATIHGHKYILAGMPFFNKDREDDFDSPFKEKLGL